MSSTVESCLYCILVFNNNCVSPALLVAVATLNQVERHSPVLEVASLCILKSPQYIIVLLWEGGFLTCPAGGPVLLAQLSFCACKSCQCPHACGFQVHRTLTVRSEQGYCPAPRLQAVSKR